MTAPPACCAWDALDGMLGVKLNALSPRNLSCWPLAI